MVTVHVITILSSLIVADIYPPPASPSHSCITITVIVFFIVIIDSIVITIVFIMLINILTIIS